MSLSLDDENQEARAILRLVNGPLCGCEYRLPSGTTLLVAGAADTLLGSKHVPEIPEFPENAIVVPIEGGLNFEITIEDNGRDGFRLRTLGSQSQEQICNYQKICQVGTLQFSVRSIETVWIQEVAEFDPHEQRQPDLASRSMVVKALFGMACICVLLVAAWALWFSFSEKKRVAEVASIVAGSSEQYDLLKGRNGIVYVFAKSVRDVSWARQALTREGAIASASVSTADSEETRINKLLLENYPSVYFHRVKILDPARPSLVLSQERAHLSAQTRQALTTSLMSWMPYAENISIGSWYDAMLDGNAKVGLERLGVVYERSSSANNVNYGIRGNLTDIELMRLQAFTAGFYRDFGRRYITFSVALRDDFSKGKSFKYGASAYVKMAPQHWFFSQIF